MGSAGRGPTPYRMGGSEVQAKLAYLVRMGASAGLLSPGT